MLSLHTGVFWALAALSLRGPLAAEMASVSGTVVNDATGAPVRNALLTLSTLGSRPLDATVHTNNDGAFSFEAPAGRYYLEASHDGYASVAFGAPEPDIAPAIMILHSGEVRQGVRLRLLPLGAISGTVVDQDNDPVLHAMVRLVVPKFAYGRPTWQTLKTAHTNDRGEFRLHGIVPGRYDLLALAPQSPASAVRPEISLANPAPTLVYMATFYFGVASITQATAIEVHPGAELRNVVLQMGVETAASINGTVNLPGRISADDIVVRFARRGEDAGLDSSGASARIMPDGRFFVPRLAPGRYHVTVSIAGLSGLESEQEFDIHSGPQQIHVEVTPALPLRGHLSIEGQGADVANMEVTLAPQEAGVTSATARVRPDGSFEFRTLAPGAWDATVEPLPKGGYIKSIALGNQDVLTSQMIIGQRAFARLNIVVSTRGAVVNGTVKQPQNDEADLTGHARAKMLLAPSGPLSEVLRFYSATTADADGRFEFEGVAPGSYKIFALDRMQDSAWLDPGFMKRIDGLGQALEVHEGEHVSLNVEMKAMPRQSPDEP